MRKGKGPGTGDRGRGRGPGARGFSLLEVLIAIVILVFAISSIIPLFAVGSTSHKRGIDQAQVAWLAPRIAARIQERLYKPSPEDLKGVVREREDGSLLIDTWSQKLSPNEPGDYFFEATFKPMPGASQSDPLAGTAFLLKVEVRFKAEGSPIVETYETVVLRKLLR